MPPPPRHVLRPRASVPRPFAQQIAVLAAVALVSGCSSISPGMRMNESPYTERESDLVIEQGVSFRLIPITAKLLQEHEASRLRPVAEPTAGRELTEQLASYQYQVKPHDILTVTVWDHPELTIPAGEFRSAELVGHPVNQDGTIFYPHVGVVSVAGKTLGEIRELLTARLRTYIEKPQLDVRVAAFRGQKIHVVGEVMEPAILPITDVPMTVLEAINLAKGFSPEADRENVSLIRDGTTTLLNVQALVDHGDLSQNRLVRDGDIVQVPDRSRNKVFVFGEVKKPAALLMHKGRLSLTEALGGAEGIDPVTSNAGRIYVIRGRAGEATVYRLDASSPDALILANHFPLGPGDIVYVETYGLTRWNRVISQILPTVQLLWQSVDFTRTIVPAVP